MMPYEFAKMRRAFNIVAKHYRLSKAAQITAWESAQADPEKAMRCYAAIVRSF